MHPDWQTITPLISSGPSTAPCRWCLGAVALAVALLHMALIFGPDWPLLWPRLPAAPTEHRLQAVWIEAAPPAPEPRETRLETPPQPPPPKPAAAPAAIRAAKPDARPVELAPAPAPAPAPEPAPEPLSAPQPLATPAGVELQTAEGQPAPSAPIGADPEAAPAAAPAALTLLSPDGLTRHLAIASSAVPASMQLDFKVNGLIKGMQYQAKAELLWEPQAGSYAARQTISAFLLGSLEQTSRGQITDQGLQPSRFEDRRLRKRRAASLDWAAGLARFEPEREPAAIGPGTQDRLSIWFQLAALVQSDPGLRSAGSQISLPTLGTSRLQIWRFRVRGLDQLDLPAGQFQALRLERLAARDGRPEGQIWLAPALGYLPVRIQLDEDNGDHLDLQLSRSAMASAPDRSSAAPPDPATPNDESTPSGYDPR